MKTRSIALIAALFLGPSLLLFSAAKVVRATTRAAIYIEPSRSSTRIDLVEKGTLLNLLQPTKIKDIWYYVSFTSPRYGSRLSGFILASAVELVPEETKVAPAAPEAPARVEEKRETKPEPPAPPAAKEELGLSVPPQGRSLRLPAKERVLEEAFWQTLLPAPEKEKTAVEAREFQQPTPSPGLRKVSFPKREKPREDVPWEIIKPSPVEKPIVSPAKPTTPPRPKPAPQALPEVRRAGEKRRRGPISLGLGYGASFGGAGGWLQVRARMGLAVHAGVGLFPTTLIYSDTDWVKNQAFWSAGIKYYLPFGSSSFYPYLDLQYGGLRIEAAQVVIGIFDLDYVYFHDQKSLWGPSILAGAEFRKGRFGLNGAVGMSYVLTEWEFLQSKTSLAYDLSLVIYF